MSRDERWKEDNRAHVLTFEFFKQIYRDDPELILAREGKLETLTYYNSAAGADSNDNDMRAFDAAAQLIRFAHVRGIRFESGKSRDTALSEFDAILKDGEKEIFQLAVAVDEQYHFGNEKVFG